MEDFAPKWEEDYGEEYMIQNGGSLEQVRSEVQEPHAGFFSLKHMKWTWRYFAWEEGSGGAIPWEGVEDFIKGEESVGDKSYKFARRNQRRNANLKHPRANCYLECARFTSCPILPHPTITICNARAIHVTSPTIYTLHATNLKVDCMHTTCMLS